MKKIITFFKRLFCGIFGIEFLICALGGIMACFSDRSNLIQYIVFILIFLVIGIVLLKVAFNNQSKKTPPAQNTTIEKEISSSSNHIAPNTVSTPTDNSSITVKEEIPSSSSQYIETENSIAHTDGSTISDEEIPYLIQLGYENELRKTGQFSGEVLDTSFVNQNLAEKRKATIIPSYQDILHFTEKCEAIITSTDIYFLKYINGRTVENAKIAQYWYYEYGLNYTNEIHKLYASGLLVISNINISKLKVDDLKNILRHFNLQLSGKKSDLINRITNNISLEDLSSFLGDSIHYFCTTDKGNSLINEINDSATFNLELENKALSLILDDDYETAFNLIWDYKKQTPAEKNCHYNYSPDMDKIYDSIMNCYDFFYTLKKDRDIEENIRAAIVFCRMYGLGQDKVRKLIMRIYKESGHEFSEDAKNLINGRLL